MLSVFLFFMTWQILLNWYSDMLVLDMLVLDMLGYAGFGYAWICWFWICLDMLVLVMFENSCLICKHVFKVCFAYCTHCWTTAENVQTFTNSFYKNTTHTFFHEKPILEILTCCSLTCMWSSLDHQSAVLHSHPQMETQLNPQSPKNPPKTTSTPTETSHS